MFCGQYTFAYLLFRCLQHVIIDIVIIYDRKRVNDERFDLQSGEHDELAA